MAITRNRLLASALILLMVAFAASAIAAEDDELYVLTYGSGDLESVDSVRQLYHRIPRFARHHCPDDFERGNAARSTDCANETLRDLISASTAPVRGRSA